MTYEECACCGKKIGEGHIRFVVRVSVLGDDGGVLAEEEYSDVDMKIEELIAELEGQEAYELENDVFEERIFVLCGACRKIFMKNPFGFRTRGILSDDDEMMGPIQ
ncbi:MAG: hypothetical protein OEY50_07465 [Nitrospinota bacterium]|nr:hypothetical protein [Nitrospinota bacterium]MDH5679541.1 hypothetical protein [Nitrospinota bacterium]MDH5756754.1 hypothetical protein [Nitrospinota bacterium]